MGFCEVCVVAAQHHLGHAVKAIAGHQRQLTYFHHDGLCCVVLFPLEHEAVP